MVGTGVLSETDLVSAINWTALGVLLGMFIIGSCPLVYLPFNQFLFNTAPIALAILAVNSSLLYLMNHGFLHRDAMSRHRNRGPLQLPNPSSAVKDRGLLKVSLVSLGLAVTFLIVHTFLGVSAALATLLPAFLILVYESSRSTEVRDVLGRIDCQ